MTKLFFITLLLFTNSLTAGTTRLKSTAGVGVGSILLDEATFLNPASSAFFNIGALYYQKTRTESVQGDAINYESNLFIASDAKGKLAGSISYQTNSEFEDGKNISVSLSSIVGDRSATGVTYHYEDGGEKSKYVTMGVTHAVNDIFTMGFVLRDPLRSKQNNSHVIVGLQYTYKEFITLNGDFGTDWKDRFDEKLQYGGSVQFKVFDDFYIRAGQKIDRQQSLKTTGAGGSWGSPRFVVNGAINFIENTIDNSEEKETTFSVSYKF